MIDKKLENELEVAIKSASRSKAAFNKLCLYIVYYPPFFEVLKQSYWHSSYDPAEVLEKDTGLIWANYNQAVDLMADGKYRNHNAIAVLRSMGWRDWGRAKRLTMMIQNVRKAIKIPSSLYIGKQTGHATITLLKMPKKDIPKAILDNEMNNKKREFEFVKSIASGFYKFM